MSIKKYDSYTHPDAVYTDSTNIPNKCYIKDFGVAIETCAELPGTDCPADLCSRCGYLVESESNYCSHCGLRFIYRYRPDKPYSRFF